MKNSFYIFLLAALMISTRISVANNISVTSVSLTGQNTGSQYTLVQFSISWENSWRTSSAPNNWDAAWVFVKYKVSGNYVSASGATSSGTTITVGSTTGVRVGMPVSKTGGSGTIAAGTVVTAITDANHFTVSAAPSPVLSGSVVVTGAAIWEPATLNSTGHTAPGGSTITSATDGTGAFIYNSRPFNGTNNFTGTQLRWNYGVNGVADGASVEIKVFAIEMVYVPTGSFYAGDGTISTTNSAFQNGQFTNNGSTAAYQITSESVPATLGGASGDMMNNNAIGMASGSADDFNNTTQQSLPTAFPKGYNAFYCMKYEISQQGYVDFLNSLTQTQATTRKVTFSSNRYAITGSAIGSYATTNPYVACNELTWADVAAYLDWSGLRPMTELEFEKACRGTLAAVANECAWGTVGFAGSAYTLSNSGANSEVIATNYYPSGGTDYVSAAGATGSGTLITVGSTVGLVYGMPVSVTAGTGAFAAGTFVTYIQNATTFYVQAPPLTALSGGAVVTGSAICGNVAFTGTIPSAGAIKGPVRAGIFAGTTGNTGRITAGATYYGIMEMSGNVFERPVTVGNTTGRLFTGIHGNGTINATGDADATTWPGTDAIGIGFRGGVWNFSYSFLRVSNRTDAVTIQATNGVGTGGRGVRLAP